jgi:hypothetical protein
LSGKKTGTKQALARLAQLFGALLAFLGRVFWRTQVRARC